MDTSEQPLTYKCFLCYAPSFVGSTDGSSISAAASVSQYNVECSRCGNYKISSRAAKIISGRDLTKIQRANISGFISENQNYLIKEDDLDFLQSLRTPSHSEKAVKLMRRISREVPTAGESFMINYWAIPTIIQKIEATTGNNFPNDPAFDKQCRESLLWLAVVWSQKAEEFIFILRTYLYETLGLLGAGEIDGYYTITPKGWEFVENLKAPDSNSSSAFVAMWFDASVHSTWLEAIKPAVEDAGYEPIRIDKVEHNNRIDDEIVAGIRACKFLVADFTGQRGGVYFEAGLAQGLGKQVIWLCKKDDLANVHFDTRQYNFIVWQVDDLPQLRFALKNRIEATIGKGGFRKA
jgi:hypothetical protein